MSSWRIKAGFQVILLHGPCLILGPPYYEPLLWFMILISFAYEEVSLKMELYGQLQVICPIKIKIIKQLQLF